MQWQADKTTHYHQIKLHIVIRLDSSQSEQMFNDHSDVSKNADNEHTLPFYKP